MIQKITFFVCIWLSFTVAGLAQVDSTATDSVEILDAPVEVEFPADTLQADTLQSDSEQALYRVRRWNYHAPIGAHLAATDSTLRWQVWPDWTYKKNRDPGVISYRLGTIGRTNTQQINAHEPQYQELYWEDIRLTDPVSGITNWSYIPHHKVEYLYENDRGITHRTKFKLKEYYLNKPLTQLNYTESSFDTRSLEFVVSRNFGQKTNAEISYWDRRDGGEYDNSSVVGRQLYARVTHQLDQRQKLKFNVLNNKFDNSLPFGYMVGNPETFNFDRFQTQPVESNASADRASTIVGLHYYRRPADTTQTTHNFQAGLFLNSAKREATFTADTTRYNTRALGVNIRKWQQLGPVQLEGGASYSYYINKDQPATNLITDNWGLLSTQAKASFEPVSIIQLNSYANYRLRGDDFSDYQLGAAADFSLSRSISLQASFATGSRMPTPQQLYWQADTFQGNANLQNEEIQSIGAQVEIAAFKGSTVGLKANLKQIDKGIRIGSDSTFANANPYSSLSTAAYFDYESTLFEFSGSATLQQFGSFLTSRSELLPVDENQRIWLKGSAYIKGYLFNRATYVKGGLSGIFSPQPYGSARYFPSLDFWQSGTAARVIPSFNRLDADFSARLRSIIILLRYENVLDGLTQQGYFETAGYPQGSRRLIFGVRVLLRN